MSTLLRRFPLTRQMQPMRNKMLLVISNEPENTLGSATMTTRRASSIASPSGQNLAKARDAEDKARFHLEVNRNSRRSTEADRRLHEELSRPTKNLEGTILLRGSRPLLKERHVKRQSYKPIVLRDELSSEKIFSDARDSSRWLGIASALEEWRNLEDDWDGVDALAPSHKVLNVVSSFVAQAEHYGVSEPRPFIDSSGEVGFIWGNLSRASVSFSMDDRFSAFCPREEKVDLRIAGPLDIALCSPTLFESLRDHSAL